MNGVCVACTEPKWGFKSPVDRMNDEARQGDTEKDRTNSGEPTRAPIDHDEAAGGRPRTRRRNLTAYGG